MSKDTKKLAARLSSVLFMCPTAMARHSTFVIWTLIMDFTSSTLATMFSLRVNREENLPVSLRSGSRIHGIYLIRDSEAAYFLVSFWTNFLFFVSFLQHFNVHVGDLHGLGFITVLVVSRTQRTWGEKCT